VAAGIRAALEGHVEDPLDVLDLQDDQMPSFFIARVTGTRVGYKQGILPFIQHNIVGCDRIQLVPEGAKEVLMSLGEASPQARMTDAAATGSLAL
jgi:hypothetical protein